MSNCFLAHRASYQQGGTSYSLDGFSRRVVEYRYELFSNKNQTPGYGLRETGDPPNDTRVIKHVKATFNSDYKLWRYRNGITYNTPKNYSIVVYFSKEDCDDETYGNIYSSPHNVCYITSRGLGRFLTQGGVQPDPEKPPTQVWDVYHNNDGTVEFDTNLVLYPNQVFYLFIRITTDIVSPAPEYPIQKITYDVDYEIRFN